LQRDFPDHEIRGILGRGGMGAVYKAWQKSLNRLVAIKILPPAVEDGVSDFTERFKREANAMARLRHCGIFSIFGAGETPGGCLYFVIGCVEGTDVQRLLTGHGRVEPREALRITIAVCDAHAYAHRRGFIHRDIKPSNVMLDAFGAVKIADFGLAKCTAPGTAALAMPHVAMGTPEFMAPEALKDAANVDHRADLYSVGVMLYYMLTGKIPHSGFIPPSRAVPDLGRQFDRIVARALQREPAARFSSATEFREALDPIFKRIVAKRTTADNRGTTWRKTALLFSVVAILILGIPALMIRWRRDARPVAPPPGGSAVTAGAPIDSKDAAAFGSYRYLVMKEQLPWMGAKARAEAMGGHLATLTNADERDFVNALCAKALPRKLRPAWLGGICNGGGGPWTWVTGEPFAFTDWESGKPLGIGAAWLSICPVGEAGYAWREIPQTSAAWTKHVGGFVVEWEKVKRRS
jgi:hypothetical protein